MRDEDLFKLALIASTPFLLGLFLIAGAGMVCWKRGMRARVPLLVVLSVLLPLPFPAGVSMLLATNQTWMPLAGLGAGVMLGGLIVIAGVSERAAPIALSLYAAVAVPLLLVVFGVWITFDDNWLFSRGSGGVFAMAAAVIAALLWKSLAPGTIALVAQLYEQSLERTEPS